MVIILFTCLISVDFYRLISFIFDDCSMYVMNLDYMYVHVSSRVQRAFKIKLRIVKFCDHAFDSVESIAEIEPL